MRIDWQRVVLNLRRRRPLAQIAREVGLPQARLQALARGEVRQVRDWLVCVRLLDLHSDLCPERHRMEALTR